MTNTAGPGAPAQTVRQYLELLANTNTSTEQDNANMAGILHRHGFPQAIVTCGIVYLDGQGTINTPPTDLHTIAKMILQIGARD